LREFHVFEEYLRRGLPLGGRGVYLLVEEGLTANSFSKMAEITTILSLYLLWKYQRH
jgi:hypothetical protein